MASYLEKLKASRRALLKNPSLCSLAPLAGNRFMPFATIRPVRAASPEKMVWGHVLLTVVASAHYGSTSGMTRFAGWKQIIPVWMSMVTFRSGPA